MKIGIEIRIDVTKIDKSRIYVGEKGKYLNLTTFVDTENKDQYGNHGFISQSTSKEERDAGVKPQILGNSKVFFKKDSEQQQAPEVPPPPFEEDPIDDVPF